MRVLSPTLGSPDQGSCTGKTSPQNIWLWRSVGLNFASPTGLGEIKDFTLTGHTQNLMSTRTQVQSINLIEVWDRPLASLWRVSQRDKGQLWPFLGTQTLVAAIRRTILPCEYCCWFLLYWFISTRSWPHPIAYRHQCWDTWGQTPHWVGTQSPSSADRLPEDFLSPQTPLDMTLDTALPTRGPRPRTTYQWAGPGLSYQEACTRL